MHGQPAGQEVSYFYAVVHGVAMCVKYGFGVALFARWCVVSYHVSTERLAIPLYFWFAFYCFFYTRFLFHSPMQAEHGLLQAAEGGHRGVRKLLQFLLRKGMET
jgi:hypothetical protein